MPTTASNGVTIHFEVEGQGPAVVIQHGFLGSPASWREAGYVDALADRYRVILIDARGHGRSDKPHDISAYSYEQMAADVLAVLDAAGVERTHFWGYSMGACIGLRLGRAAPGRIRSLILGGCQPFPTSEVDLAEMRAWSEALRHGMEWFVSGFEEREGPLPPELKARWLRLDGHALAASCDSQLEEDREGMAEPFADLTMPSLFYAGTSDPVACHLPRAAAALPDARAVLFGGYGHADAFDNIEIVPYVRAFLAAAEGREQAGPGVGR